MIGKRRSQDYGLRITGGHPKESFSRFPIVADELCCRRSRVIAYDNLAGQMIDAAPDLRVFIFRLGTS